ncbi:MAG TPA: hypothetical protein VEA16_13865 [Vicinamibacterales bacterium]|nr:hypothetical protein [Vicinamibacterales bacterium]
MKRVIAITALALAVVVAAAYAQSTTTSTSKPLAEVAKDEEARRKSVRKPAKMYTNGDLRPDVTKGGTPPASPGASVAAGNASAANVSPTSPATPAAPARQDQAYWAGRIKQAREALQRSQIFADSLQSRINALQTDYVNRDDPAQRSKIEADRNAALAELERVKKDIQDQTKAIAAIEDEARRAGVPSGWLRPGP